MASELGTITEDIAKMLVECKSLLDILDKIALKPITGGTLDYLDQLIQCEQIDKEDGWQKRVENLRKLKDECEYMIKIKDGKLSKSSLIEEDEDVQQLIREYEKKSRSISNKKKKSSDDKCIVQ